MHAPARLACSVAAVSLLSARSLDAQALDRRQLERIEQTLRQEGQEIVALADAAAAGEPMPGDFTLGWHNDYLKAQTGTFIPFVVLIEAKSAQAEAALLYVRGGAQPRRRCRRRPRSRPRPATASAAGRRLSRSRRFIPWPSFPGSRCGSPAAVRWRRASTT